MGHILSPKRVVGLSEPESGELLRQTAGSSWISLQSSHPVSSPRWLPVTRDDTVLINTIAWSWVQGRCNSMIVLHCMMSCERDHHYIQYKLHVLSEAITLLFFKHVHYVLKCSLFVWRCVWYLSVIFAMFSSGILYLRMLVVTKTIVIQYRAIHVYYMYLHLCMILCYKIWKHRLNSIRNISNNLTHATKLQTSLFEFTN